jgi:hypothetical protein
MKEQRMDIQRPIVVEQLARMAAPPSPIYTREQMREWEAIFFPAARAFAEALNDPPERHEPEPNPRARVEPLGTIYGMKIPAEKSRK